MPADDRATDALRDVLIIGYHFPPDASAGALRWQKFAKYLPDHGYRPHVLTIPESDVAARDDSRLADVRAAEVHRTAAFPNPREAALRSRAALLRLFGRQATLQRFEQADARLSFAEKDRAANDRLASARRALLSLCWLPDAHLGWLPPAFWRGVSLCRRHRFTAMISSGPPHTAHLVGLALKRACHVRWLADFRDPWTTNPGKPAFVRSALSDRLETAMERAVVRAADRVIAVNDRLRESLARAHAPEPASKFVTIANGFDGLEMATLPAAEPTDVFTITHVGTLYYRRSPLGVLRAVASLIEERTVARQDIRVRFIGATADGNHVEDVVAALGLGAVVETQGPVPHPQALAAMRGSDLLLLLAQGQPDQIPAKAFEYLAAGPPTLAITEDGATADLIHASGGVVCADDPQQIRTALLEALHRRRDMGKDSATDRQRIAAAYDHRRLVVDLAALLNGQC